MANPLVASSVDTASPFSGAYLIEDGQALVDAIQSGDWVEGGMAAFSAVLDTAAAVVDPIGTLIANGLGWVLDHVEPLKGWMNDFTGDAGEVMGFAQTWRNIGTRMHESADTFARRTHDLDTMSGATVDAYLAFAGDTVKHFHATGDWANAIGQGMEMASQLVQIVHDLVRDAISQVVGTAISVAAEMALTFGLATPAAITQITTKVSSLATRVGRTVTRLLSAFKKLSGLLDALKTLFTKSSSLIKKMLHGTGSETARSFPTGDAVPAAPRHTGASIDHAPKDTEAAYRWADEQYDRIRNSDTDIGNILKHPDQLRLRDGHQLTEAELSTVKRHVFLDEHQLPDYAGGTYSGRFDSDPPQAEVWGRLESGHATDLDRIWLEHELAESKYMSAHPGAAYQEAHQAANLIANWFDAYSRARKG